MGAVYDVFCASECHGGLGGWAAVVRDPRGETHEVSGGDPDADPARMELLSAVRGIEAARVAMNNGQGRINLRTDSRSVCDAVKRGWLSKWKRNGWRTQEGRAVANRDLWERLVAGSAHVSFVLEKRQSPAFGVARKLAGRAAAGAHGTA